MMTDVTITQKQPASKSLYTDQERSALLQKRSLAEKASIFLMVALILNVVAGLIDFAVGVSTLVKISHGISYYFAGQYVSHALAIFDVVLGGLFMLSAVWLAPMMVQAKKHAKKPSRGSCLALGICSIIFGGVFGIVAGILLIVAEDKVMFLALSKKTKN